MFGLTPWALVTITRERPRDLTLSLFVIAFLCGALVAAALAVVRERRKVHALGEEVADLRDETALLERRDEATGLYNSRHFVEALTREIERSRTYGRPLALALASVETRSPEDDDRRGAAPCESWASRSAAACGRSTWPAGSARPSTG